MNDENKDKSVSYVILKPPSPTHPKQQELERGGENRRTEEWREQVEQTGSDNRYVLTCTNY